MQFKFFITAISLGLSLIVSEVTLRILDPLAPHRGRVAVEHFKKAKNSKGLRGTKDFPLLHNSFRILALGDSFTYGLRLEESGTWPNQLEQVLSERHPSIEVLNGGRPGTNTKQQLRLFRNTLSDYNPDLVVVAFLLNDCTKLCSNCGPVTIAKRLENRINKPVGLARYSYIYRLLSVRLLERRLTARTIAMYKRPYERQTEPYQQCIESFHQFKRLSDLKKFRLIVFQYPMLFGLKGPYPFETEHVQVQKALQSMDIPVVDLTSAFLGQRDKDLWVHPRDSHPNRKANEIAAKRIAQELAPFLPGAGAKGL